MIRLVVFILSFIFFLPAVRAQHLQPGLGLEDESAFYAQTKQVNQFFRRFNGEENRQGNRLYKKDSLFRNRELREMYLNLLFDKQSSNITETDKQAFIREVLDKATPLFLDFHDNHWFAEVSASFLYNKKKENMLLFLKLEQERYGYKWVLTNVYFDKFLKLFYKGSQDIIEKSFLHPLSHELDFMNLYKAFENKDYAEYYIQKDHKPDYLSLLLYEIKTGNIKFEGVGVVKFHFFQVDGWYFELSYFNRSGYNTGWLISKLLRINEAEKEELIRFYQP